MTEEPRQKLGTLPFVLGGMSFIPGIGIIFGVAAAIWGIFTKKEGGRKLAIVGGAGIAFSVVLYSSLFYFGFLQRGGVYDDLRVKLSETNLTALVPAIEFYRIQNGKYPDSLEDLQKSQPENSTVFVFDPTDIKAAKQSRYFYYEVPDKDHYYLLGVGPDGQPFTSDDQYPTVKSTTEGTIGFLKKAIK